MNAAPPPSPLRIEAPIRAVTHEPRHHFFGYYDKCPWDATGRCLLALETSFMDRLQTGDDAATLGLVDLDSGAWRPLAETHGWSWQQGAMAQWAPWAPAREILFNDREDGRFVTRIWDIERGLLRTLPLPVSAVAPDGSRAVSTNFARRYYIRAGYGYAGPEDPFKGQGAPDGDGLWVMDLRTGAHRLLVSLARLAALSPLASMAGATHWLDLEGFRPDSRRVLFFHRWHLGNYWQTRIYTVNADGSDLYRLHDHDKFSHFCWKDNEHVLAWARQPGTGDRYYLYRDGTQEAESLGEGILTVDGHCTYAPDGRWILTDTYPDKERFRTLILYRPETRQRLEIGRFFAPRELDGEFRCDLHPRWSRDGARVCIDSVHEGARQIYVLEVGEILKRF